MPLKVGRTFAAALVISLLIQMHIAENGYAFRRTKIAFTSGHDGNVDIYVMNIDGWKQEKSNGKSGKGLASGMVSRR